jgi:26S proteasome regulatory subunit T1
MPKQEE